MTLGEIIHYLERLDPSAVSKVRVSNAHSYRGDYSQLAVEYAFTPQTARETLGVFQAALGTTQEGYKGGDFEMRPWVDVHLAKWGCCGEQIGPVTLALMFGSTGR